MLPSTDNPSLLLWMSHLDTAVSDVFQQMLGIPCRPSAPPANTGDQLKVTISLLGDFAADCTLYFSEPGAKAAALAFLGDEDAQADLLIIDAVGEIGNMIIGSLKSTLISNPAASMTVPSVSRERSPSLSDSARGDRSRRYYEFLGNTMQIHLAMAGPLD